MNAAASDNKILKSVCYSCHGGCSVHLHIDNGVLTKVSGDPDGPLNHGAICPLGVAVPDLVYHPDRLHYPMRRTGSRGSGQWQRICWDEALDTIAAKLKRVREEFGPESVLMGTGTGRQVAKWVIRFANAIGTPNWIEPGTAQCFVPRVNVGFLTFGAFPVGDFSGHTRPECILYWGHNPLYSGPDGETRFAAHENLKPGTKVIVVDPRETQLAKRADVWLRVRPGTDDALALAMLHVIVEEKLYDAEFVGRWTHGFDELAAHLKQHTPEWAEPITWVPAANIRAAARIFAQAKPAQLEWGCAIEHTPNSIQSARAIAMLPALTANIDVPGGWVFGPNPINRFPWLFDKLTPEIRAKRLGNEFKLLGDESAMPAAHIPAVFKAMRDSVPYPIKAFLVFGNNALTTYADARLVEAALKKVDFMVVADFFMTPTAELADIVLPAATWAEIKGLHMAPFASSYVVGALQPAVQIGECRSDGDVLIELARRLNLDLGKESLDELLAYQLGTGKIKTSYDAMQDKTSTLFPIEYRKYEKNGFNTPTGKIELYSTRLEKMGYAPLPFYSEPPESPYSTPELAKQYPLVLTTGHRSPHFFHSEGRQIRRLRKAHKDPRTEIHPDTAAALGIGDGDWMWIESPRGKIRQRAKFAPTIDPRVIAGEHGWWYPEQPGPDHGVWQSNINMLTSQAPPYDEAMGTYQLRGLLCRVSKCELAT